MAEDQMIRTLMMPAEGIIALQTITGILDDHEVPIDPVVADRLSRTLHEATPFSTGAEGEELGVELTIQEADVLLRGLAFTEAMSVELPWYDMVVHTVQFVGDALVELWTDAEWLAYRDNRPR